MTVVRRNIPNSEKTTVSLSLLLEKMKAETLLVFFVAAIFLQSKNVYGFNGNRIRNGSETPVGKYEFLPALIMIIQGPGIHKIQSGTCSSTIISKRHILTAAHCVIASSADPKRINRVAAMLVDYRPKEKMSGHMDGTLIKIELPLHSFSIQPKIYFHQSYSAQEYYFVNLHHKSLEIFLHDLAIIEFPEGIDLHITPITLASGYVEEEGDTAIAAGYGTYDYKYNPDTQKLQAISPTKLLDTIVPIHMPDKCSLGENVPSLICTGTFTAQADHGDSGGPLFVKRNETFYQLGVTSIGTNGTAFYVRVDKYCNWISKITKGEAECKPLPPPDDKEKTTFPPQYPEPLKASSNILFTLNILYLFLCIGIFLWV